MMSTIAARAPHELRLRSRRELEVHSSKRSLALVEGDVRLRDQGFSPWSVNSFWQKARAKSPGRPLPLGRG